MARKHGRMDEHVSRPMNVYLLFAAMSVLIIISAYMGRDAITGLVTGTGGSPDGGTALQSGVIPFPDYGPEPACAAECGRACWLVTSGLAEGIFDTAQGKIGILGCNGNCFDVTSYIQDMRCCRHSECPSGNPVCQSMTGGNAECMAARIA